ncbi:MAG: hypothetical protein R3E61_08320 [Pseudomonadales bacterium]
MIKPHGADTLQPRFVSDASEHAKLTAEAAQLPSVLISSAAAGNAVMMGAGYFTPLKGYMNLADSLSVAEKLHTTDGLFWPVPIVNVLKDVSAIKGAKRIALRDPNVESNPVIAVMDVDAIDEASDEQMQFMAQQIFGTLDEKHPGVATFLAAGRFLVSGAIQVLNYSYFPQEFPDTFRTATEIREEISSAVGKKWWRFKHVTRCTVRTKNCAAWRKKDCKPMASSFTCCSAN